MIIYVLARIGNEVVYCKDSLERVRDVDSEEDFVKMVESNKDIKCSLGIKDGRLNMEDVREIRVRVELLEECEEYRKGVKKKTEYVHLEEEDFSIVGYQYNINGIRQGISKVGEVYRRTIWLRHQETHIKIGECDVKKNNIEQLEMFKNGPDELNMNVESTLEVDNGEFKEFLKINSFDARFKSVNLNNTRVNIKSAKSYFDNMEMKNSIIKMEGPIKNYSKRASLRIKDSKVTEEIGSSYSNEVGVLYDSIYNEVSLENCKILDSVWSFFLVESSVIGRMEIKDCEIEGSSGIGVIEKSECGELILDNIESGYGIIDINIDRSTIGVLRIRNCRGSNLGLHLRKCDIVLIEVDEVGETGRYTDIEGYRKSCRLLVVNRLKQSRIKELRDKGILVKRVKDTDKLITRMEALGSSNKIGEGMIAYREEY